jgi:hypothetical protein
MASRRAKTEAARQVLREDVDRIATLVGTVVAAVVQPVPLVVGGAGVIFGLVGWRLVNSYRRALKLVREKHLPVVIAVGCTDEEFRTIVRDAFQTVSDYGFEETLYARDYDLSREDFTLHREERLPEDPAVWQRLALRARRLVVALHSRVPGRKVYHFFLRAPVALGIGLGAALGTKYEFFFHHYQPAAGENPYHPLLQVTAETVPGEGAHTLKTRVQGEFQHVQARGVEGAQGRVFAALGLAGHDPGPVADLAAAQGAAFVDLRSHFAGTIPVDADWLRIAREVNTVLLGLVGQPGVQELHLFPAVPLPLAFAIGMGLDTRSPVRVYQWDAPEKVYHEVLRLNELVAGERD